MTKTLIATPDRPTCLVHTDTPLVPTRNGWVCPQGCGDMEAGRRFRDLPEVGL